MIKDLEAEGNSTLVRGLAMKNIAELEILHNITKLVTRELSPENLLPLISKELKKILDFDRISISIYDHEKKKFNLRAIVIKKSSKTVFKGNYPGPGSRTYICMSTKDTIYFPDLLDKKDYFETNYLIDEGYLSGLCIPLIMGTDCFGTLNFNSHKNDPFTPLEISFLEAVSEPVAIAMRNALAFEEINKIKDLLSIQNKYLTGEAKGSFSPQKIIGNSEAFKRVIGQIKMVSPSNATVVMIGETGTGKEIAAELIHDMSPRSKKPLVKVNCAAIPGTLLESELFGYEKGAFTGAVRSKAGRFELADEGTIFLDEISEMGLDLQAKILRVLQDGQITRVGGNHPKSVDFRVVAATNKNLHEEVRVGKFREDLFFRLNVFPIVLPPLRDRKDDIPELAEFFIGKSSRIMGKSFRGLSKRSLELIWQYAWPGNIRELSNVIERACILTPQGEKINIAPDMLTFRKKKMDNVLKTMAKVEKEHLINALKHSRGQIEGPNGAAQILGMYPSTLRGRLRKYRIKINKVIDGEEYDMRD